MLPDAVPSRTGAVAQDLLLKAHILLPMSLIAEVRSFNRFFTRRIGVLGETHLESPYSLAEVRVLYEIAHGDGWTAGKLGRELGLDRGYVSRVLAKLERAELIARAASPADGAYADSRSASAAAARSRRSSSARMR